MRIGLALPHPRHGWRCAEFDHTPPSVGGRPGAKHAVPPVCILELDVGLRASDTQHQRRCPTGDGVFVSHAESISRLLDINVGSREQRVCLQVSPIPADVRSETGQHANAQVHPGAESSSEVRIGKVPSGKQDAGNELEPHTILSVGHTWCAEQDGNDDSEKDCLHDDYPICASKAATPCARCARHAAVRRFNARSGHGRYVPECHERTLHGWVQRRCSKAYILIATQPAIGFFASVESGDVRRKLKLLGSEFSMRPVDLPEDMPRVDEQNLILVICPALPPIQKPQRTRQRHRVE